MSTLPSTSDSSKYSIFISPPLLNSSNPWATTPSDLKALYECPHTGAVTIRTSPWEAFSQHPLTHQYTFFSLSTGHAASQIDTSQAEGRGEVLNGETSSLNTLGYSPIAFEAYVEMLVRMSQNGELNRDPVKPFIISVTGTATEVGECYAHLLKVQNDPDGMYPNPDPAKLSTGLGLMMEINLSCPNIPDKPPPAYDGASLAEYVNAIEMGASTESKIPVHVGIKTPPYTYQGQFQTLVAVLEESTRFPGGCPISFITATNTLGSCLVLKSDNEAALGSVNGTGIGGLAGDALHPIALGNVKTIRSMLDASPCSDLHRIAIIGIGGVSDSAGFKRMKSVGASAVGVGTALGREGIQVFSRIASGLSRSVLELRS